MVKSDDFFTDKIVPTTIAVTFSMASLLSTTTFTATMTKQAVILPAGHIDSADRYTSKGYRNVFGIVPPVCDANVSEETSFTDVIEVHDDSIEGRLKQIKDVLPQYFPVKEFLVEKINDSEDGGEIFMLSALTDKNIEQALDGLEKFNKSWWIDHYNPAICIDVIAI